MSIGTYYVQQTMILVNLVNNIDADNVLERIDSILSRRHGVDQILRLRRLDAERASAL